MTRRKSTYAAGASDSGAPGCPEFAACTASIASVRIASMQSRSCFVNGSGANRCPRVALRHLGEREHLVVICVAGGAELRQPLRRDLLLRLARGLEERPRVELGRARAQRLAQRGGDRQSSIG